MSAVIKKPSGHEIYYMTNEEREVIAAALDARDGIYRRAACDGSGELVRLLNALGDLRESRKPQPKWRSGSIGFVGPDGKAIDQHEAVLLLLNKADPA